MTCAYSLVLKGTAQEIVLINRDPRKAEGEASYLQHAVRLGQPVKVTAGNYKDAANSAIVVFIAGAASSDKEESRLEMLEKNATILRDCLTSSRQSALQECSLLPAIQSMS